MKTLLIVIATAAMCGSAFCQTKKQPTMKLNAGIVTSKLAETKRFYTSVLSFSITFENDFYLLLKAPNHGGEISFLQPHHPSQQQLFHKPFNGTGVYLTIEVDHVDTLYKQIKAKNIAVEIPLRDEPWGDRHFAVTDPNGLAIDIVRYAPPQ